MHSLASPSSRRRFGRLALACTAAAAALLAGCGKQESAPAAGAAAPAAGSGAASVEEVAAKAQGFSVGPTMSSRVVYVFFDPQCPHCAALWESAKPVKQVRFVWVPISLLNGNSGTQGAAILAAQDPAAAMEGHEQAMRAGRGGILAEGNLDAQKAAVKVNTELFNKYSFNSVPTLVMKNASGGTVTHSGALETPALIAWAGAAAQ